ncbi:hypothetical protein NL676_026683 [Syzygium grande]|nr:hypothetical protein NL676_026683 [Syzygium grande]
MVSYLCFYQTFDGTQNRARLEVTAANLALLFIDASATYRTTITIVEFDNDEGVGGAASSAASASPGSSSANASTTLPKEGVSSCCRGPRGVGSGVSNAFSNRVRWTGNAGAMGRGKLCESSSNKASFRDVVQRA